MRNFDHTRCHRHEAPVFWATLGYLQFWWAFDGPRWASIRGKGAFDVPTLRAVALEYNVSRLILGKAKSAVEAAEGEMLGHDPSAAAFCAILNEARQRWPATMPERAAECAEIVKRVKDRGVAKRELVSAVTKFMWFLEPTNWTVFDSFASKGLGAGSSRTVRKQMCRFYDALHARGFVDLLQEMQQQIDATPLRGLPATRIIDTLLMARGGRGNDLSSIDLLRGFLLVLPDATRDAAVACAASLQRRFGSDMLKPDHGKTTH